MKWAGIKENNEEVDWRYIIPLFILFITIVYIIFYTLPNYVPPENVRLCVEI